MTGNCTQGSWSVTVWRIAATTAGALSLTLLVAACSGGSAPAASPPTSPAISAVVPTASAGNVQAARRAIEGFLHAWQTQGLLKAARAYLNTDEQPQVNVGLPHLAAGSVISAKVVSSRPGGVLTLEVVMELRFTGDPGAWGQGRNTRFIAATPSADAAGYRLELATSP